MKIFTYEDRKSDAVGIQLLVLSAQRHCPGLEVDVTFPNAPPELVEWFAGRPQTTLRTDWSGGPSRNGWNIKPHLLRTALDLGEPEPIWVDSDIVFTADFHPLLAGIDAETIVVAEDYFGAPAQGGPERTTNWGLALGRVFPSTVNSCFVRVTERHRPLLERWDALMATDVYREAQASHWSKRPYHMIGDQDVLSALLQAREFSHHPVRWLKRGIDIAHCNQYGGYRAHEQVGNWLRGHTPTFLHGQGEKVWRPVDGRTVHLEVSPYTLEAFSYAHDLGTPPSWAESTLVASRLLRRFTTDRRASLIPAIVSELRDQRVLKTFVKRALGRP